MIFVTDANGAPALQRSRMGGFLAGQGRMAAADFGWIAFVHEEDRKAARTVIGARDGLWPWFAAGAIPSCRPPDWAFLGFLGSITQSGGFFVWSPEVLPGLRPGPLTKL